MGYFRKIEEDVDVHECDDLGVQIVRRTSGGGSIYTDENQLIFSSVTGQPLGDDVEDSFSQTCGCIIDALGECGISATYKPPNDVLINGKKVSGSAQVKKKRAYITHSTIILSMDHERVQRVLKGVKHGYTSSILEQCDKAISIDTLKAAIKNAYINRFGIEFKADGFSEAEQDIITKLIETKYSTREWNFKR
jgi:lipoate-protein ligase A